MNDDELTRELRAAMTERTTADSPSPELMHALATTRVRGPRPYLVPFSAAAVVTALTTGGVLVSQAGGGLLTAGSDSTPTPAAPSSVAPPSAVPSTAPITSAAAVAPTPSLAPTVTATLSTKPPQATQAVTAFPQASERVEPRTPGADDSALLAAAKSFSVVTSTVADAAHPEAKTSRLEVFPHDGSVSFFAGAQGLDWDQLAALPTDQAAFAARVKAPGAPPNPVEKGVRELVLEGPLPLPVRKNAMAMLESAPGATTTAGAHDHLGRTATKVSVTTDQLVDDFYFDPVSYRLLESGMTFSAGWKADYVAHAAVGSEPVSSFTDGYTDYTDYAITPKSS